MTTRVLPPEEWPKLAGTLSEKAWPHLDPATTRIYVVEDNGRIVGCFTLFQSWHLEGAWIAPDRRGRISVGRRLWLALRSAVRELGIREVSSMATNQAGVQLCESLGSLHLDCDHFAIGMEHLWE